MWEVPFFVPVNTGVICESVDPLKCPIVYKPGARPWISSPSSSRPRLKAATALTHTQNNGILKYVFQAKPWATLSSRMQGSLFKRRAVREWGGAGLRWKPCSDAQQECWLWKSSLLHLKSRAGLQGEAAKGSRGCTHRCGVSRTGTRGMGAP